MHLLSFTMIFCLPKLSTSYCWTVIFYNYHLGKPCWYRYCMNCETKPILLLLLWPMTYSVPLKKLLPRFLYDNIVWTCLWCVSRNASQQDLVASWSSRYLATYHILAIVSVFRGISLTLERAVMLSRLIKVSANAQTDVFTTVKCVQNAHKFDLIAAGNGLRLKFQEKT